MSGSSRWRPSGRVSIGIALGLALLGIVLVWTALPRPAGPDSVAAGTADGPSPSSPPPSAPKATSDPSASEGEQVDVRDKITGTVLPASEPVTVSIPRIGVRSKLVRLEMDGAKMEVPSKAAEAGWFTRGAAPGSLGPATIAGHVTWDGAHGVFYRLKSLRQGDQVLVTREDGRTAIFTVDRVGRYSKTRFPSRAVYGSINHAGLRLITCAGTYDHARKSYSDNVIVFAKMTDVREPGG